MIRWGGWLVVVYGAAHTIGGFVVEGAAEHVGSWIAGELRGADLDQMSPDMSAYWLTVNSFGPALILTGALLLWLHRGGTTPPVFLPSALIVWAVVNLVVIGFGAGQDLILIAAAVLLLVGTRGRVIAQSND